MLILVWVLQTRVKNISLLRSRIIHVIHSKFFFFLFCISNTFLFISNLSLLYEQQYLNKVYRRRSRGQKFRPDSINFRSTKNGGNWINFEEGYTTKHYIRRTKNRMILFRVVSGVDDWCYFVLPVILSVRLFERERTT